MAKKSKHVKAVSKIPILSGREALEALRKPTEPRRRQWKDRLAMSKVPPAPPPTESLDDEFTSKAAAPTKNEAPTTPAKSDAVTTPPAAASNLSVLDAAAQVLTDADKPLNAGAIMQQMLTKGLWSTKGKTPAATLYSALIREIAAKGKETRFQKTERGLFTCKSK